MTDTEVVDPIRIPPWLREPAERAWRDTPRIARAFIGLAILDLLARLVGLLPPALVLDTPLGLANGFVSLLWILLPAFLVLRRPDAWTATPWLLGGAIALATLGVVTRPIEGLIAPNDLQGLSGAYVAIRLVLTALTAAGWLALARGLAVLNPRRPEPFSAGLSNLVLGAFIVVAAIQLTWMAIRPLDIGDAGSNAWLAILNVAAIAGGLATAYLYWIAVRGLDDVRRPALARQVAMAGAVLAAFASLAAAIVMVALTVSPPPFDPFNETPTQGLSLVLAGMSTVGSGLVVVAFVLGIGEPPIPLAETGPPAAAPLAPEASEASDSSPA